MPSAIQWNRIDSQTWSAICNWPRYTSFDAVRDGLDYGELIRWFLWDKVARAVRHSVDPDEFAVEVSLLGWDAIELNVPALPPGSILKKIGRRMGISFGADRHSGPKQSYTFKGRPAKQNNLPKTIFLPVPSPRLIRTAESLMKEESVKLIAPESKIELSGMDRIPYPKNISPPDDKFASDLVSAVVEGLFRQEIVLFEKDVKMLREEISKQLVQIEVARRYLEEVKPEAILVHADNHPPHQHYVLLGRKLGIPSLMLQHGLDCEHFYLDYCYADAVAVWGQTRMDRYVRDSPYTPPWISVTGNPEFDTLSYPDQLDTSGKYWFWVTRPHSSSKCYSPSRSPSEGVQILKALLTSLDDQPDCSLVIKPHPYDAIELYKILIKETRVSDRVSIVDTPPNELFADASVVISEDTTAGMEAMFLGKIVVHAHFAPMKPTVDYVGYHAALPAFSQEELLVSMRKANALSDYEQAKMLLGQQSFLRKHAGPCDGLAEERVRDFILSVLNEI